MINQDFMVELTSAGLKKISEANPKLGQLAAQFLQFRVLLNNESDRACALMAAAFLDDQLRQLLEANLVQDKKVLVRILDQRGPLATFSSRIDMAYAMGLIGKRTLLDLNLLRKIRNEFAHTAEPLSFDSPKVSAWCSQLHLRIGSDVVNARQMFTRTMATLFSAITQHQVAPKGTPPAADPDMISVKRDIQAFGEKLAQAVGHNPLKDF